VPETDALWRMAMDGTMPDAAFVEQATVKTDGGLSVLTAPMRYGPLNSIKPEQIASLLDVLRKTHDYVIVDLPHALVDWIEPILARSDRLMLATDVTVPGVRATRKLMDFFLAEHPDLTIELVALQEKKPMVLGSHHKAAMELLERKFNHWVPCDRRAARDALDRGKPLSETSPRSPLAKAIARIAKGTKVVLPPRSDVHHSRPSV
jgi:pilus assembly protein CpaE